MVYKRIALVLSSETLITKTDGELNLEVWAVVCLSPVWKTAFVNIGNLRIRWWLHFLPGLPFLTCGVYVMAEKAMAPHSSTLAWRIPWTEEPGRLQFMGLRRVGHDWATSLSLFTFTHWRRKWQPTPVFLPGESQGQGSLVGCRPWGRTKSDTTEAT